MKAINIVCFLSFFISQLFINCQISEDGFQVFTIGRLVNENNEVSLTAEEGQPIIIKIRSNPTTGFQIYLKNTVSDLGESGIVKPINLNEKNGSNEYVVDSNKNSIAGVGGYSYFKFLTLGAGEEKLVFINKRSWEIKSAKELMINLLIVKPKKN